MIVTGYPKLRLNWLFGTRALSIMYTSYIYECFKPGYGVPKNRQICSRDDIFKVFSFFLLWNCGDCHISGSFQQAQPAQHRHRLGLLASLAPSDSSSWKRRRWRREKHVPWSSSATAICKKKTYSLFKFSWGKKWLGPFDLSHASWLEDFTNQRSWPHLQQASRLYVK